MRLLIATDMLLDLIAERPESIEAWNKLNALELTGSAELWAAASSYDALRAQLAEVIDDADVRSALRSTMSFITICSVDGSDVRFALDHADLPYEAAIAGRTMCLECGRAPPASEAFGTRAGRRAR